MADDTSQTTQDLAATADEIINLQSNNVPNQVGVLLLIKQMRTRTGLGLQEAKAAIYDALNRREGAYYLVAPGGDKINGPYVGLEIAEAVSAFNEGHVVVLVSGRPDGIHAAAERFLLALPDPSDRALVDLLLQTLAAHRPDYRGILEDERGRDLLITQAQQRIASRA